MKIPQVVAFGDNVSCSTTAYWDPKEKHIAREFSQLAADAFPLFADHLNFPSNIRIIVRYFKGNRRGCYIEGLKTAFLTPRARTKKGFVSTLAHELIHAEQYHTGRLVNKGRREKWWDGKPVGNKGSTYDRYRDLPWEIDAFGRQDEIALAVMKSLGMSKADREIVEILTEEEMNENDLEPELV